MDRRLPIVPFETIVSHESSAEAGNAVRTRAILNRADVIYAVDASQERHILVYGRDKLEHIANSDIPEGARVLRVGLGANRNRLQELLALVRDAKGRHDYAETA